MNANSSGVRFFIVIGVYPSGFTFIVGVCLALSGLLSFLLKYLRSIYLIMFNGKFKIEEIREKGRIALGLLKMSGNFVEYLRNKSLCKRRICYCFDLCINFIYRKKVIIDQNKSL